MSVDSTLKPSSQDGGVVATWTEQDEVLRELWLAGTAPPQIAERLGRSVAAVMTRAARLGLPRRFAPGRKPMTQRPPLPAQRSPRGGQQRPPGDHTKPAAAAPATKERICLMCLTKFPSLGAFNRICANCKDSSDYVAGSRLPDLDFPL